MVATNINPAKVTEPKLAESIEDRLARIEALLARLVEQKSTKDWYTTAELAKLMGKSDYTVREWCRQGRVKASKRECGRGSASEWIVSSDELERIKNEGLKPMKVMKDDD